MLGRMLGALLLLALSGFAGGAKPDEAKRAQARLEYDAGLKHYNLRDFDKALDKFRTAYLLVGEPALLFNIGQCERQLKKYEDARKSFQAFLRNGQPTPAQQEEVQRLIQTLDETIRANTVSAARSPELAQPDSAQVSLPAAVAAEQPRPAKRRRALVWGIVAGSIVVVAGVSIGLGVGLTRGAHYPTPTAGTIDGN